MMMRQRLALRMNRLNADGSPNTEPLELIVRDPLTGAELREDDGTPAVVITLRPMDDNERSEIMEAFTRDGVCHEKAASLEVVRRTIVTWRGLVDAHERPLPCTDDVKVRIGDSIVFQIHRRLFGVEPTVLTERNRDGESCHTTD